MPLRPPSANPGGLPSLPTPFQPPQWGGMSWEQLIGAVTRSLPGGAGVPASFETVVVAFNVPMTTWEIDTPDVSYPVPTFEDLAGDIVLPDWEYLGPHKIIATHGTPTTGRVYLR